MTVTTSDTPPSLRDRYPWVFAHGYAIHTYYPTVIAYARKAANDMVSDQVIYCREFEDMIKREQVAALAAEAAGTAIVLRTYDGEPRRVWYLRSHPMAPEIAHAMERIVGNIEAKRPLYAHPCPWLQCEFLGDSETDLVDHLAEFPEGTGSHISGPISDKETTR